MKDLIAAVEFMYVIGMVTSVPRDLARLAAIVRARCGGEPEEWTVELAPGSVHGRTQCEIALELIPVSLDVVTKAQTGERGGSHRTANHLGRERKHALRSSRQRARDQDGHHQQRGGHRPQNEKTRQVHAVLCLLALGLATLAHALEESLALFRAHVFDFFGKLWGQRATRFARDGGRGCGGRCC